MKFSLIFNWTKATITFAQTKTKPGGVNLNLIISGLCNLLSPLNSVSKLPWPMLFIQIRKELSVRSS